jgi:hypothetical protein
MRSLAEELGCDKSYITQVHDSAVRACIDI